MSSGGGWIKSLTKPLRKTKELTRKRHSELRDQLSALAREVEDVKFIAAQKLIDDFDPSQPPVPLAKSEFRVFSQFGDDGIIQYILSRIELSASEQRFIEFGVESYAESNTRFLLLHNNWRGLVMDGDEADIEALRRSGIFWRHDLTALARFITKENINSIITEAGFGGRIGLLSIDVDGNDYWIWSSITAVDPAVVIVEYNGLFGSHEAVAIPYDPGFTRQQAHYSYLYWGASLAAYCRLAESKGYVWIGSNGAGNNAYFVRRELAQRFLAPRLPDDFVKAKYRESRDEKGNLSFLGQESGFHLVQHLPVIDVVTGKTRRLEDLRR